MRSDALRSSSKGMGETPNGSPMLGLFAPDTRRE
jgi:hypothetical protein